MTDLTAVEQFLDHQKSISDFRQAIRAAIRQLWLGGMVFNFVDGMIFILQRYLTEAWAEGAATCGIREDEFTDAEIAERERFINAQFQYLLSFADDIEANSKANGGALEPLLSRGELWVLQYDAAKGKAKALACGDRKARFVLGPTEKHCRTCGGLNGRVYRYSTWVANNAVPPKNPHFECGPASYCQCYLEDTDERITPGPFPRSLLV